MCTGMLTNTSNMAMADDAVGAGRKQGRVTWGEVGNAVAMAAPQVADYLRLGTLLMPDGGSTEFTSEAMHSSINLITLAADIAATRRGPMARHRAVAKGGIAPESASEVCLEAARRVELLIEMIAERAYGKRRKIPVLAALEMFKAICRVKISYEGLDLAQRGRLTGLMKSPSFRAPRDPQRDSRLWWWITGTGIHALRPVVYLMMLKSCKEESWAPLLASLFMDVLAEAVATFGTDAASKRRRGRAASRSAEGENGGGRRDGEELEREEVQRRRMALLFYFLRPPLFNAVVRPLIELLRRILGRVPLIGSLVGVVLDMIMSLGRYYFYSNAS